MRNDHSMPALIFKGALFVKFKLSLTVGGLVKAEWLVKDGGLLEAERNVKVSSLWR